MLLAQDRSATNQPLTNMLDQVRELVITRQWLVKDLEWVNQLSFDSKVKNLEVSIDSSAEGGEYPIVIDMGGMVHRFPVEFLLYEDSDKVRVATDYIFSQFPLGFV